MNELRDQSEAAVLVHRHPRMVSIVLNRPRVLNSLNLEMIRAIDHTLDEIEADQNMQFVLFSGAGERGFCAGGDVKALRLNPGQVIFTLTVINHIRNQMIPARMVRIQAHGLGYQLQAAFPFARHAYVQRQHGYRKRVIWI